MKHYSLSDLEKYKNKDLNYIHRFFIKRHLAICKECQDRMICIEDNENLIHSIRGAVNEEMPSTPQKPYESLKTILKKSKSADDADERR